MASHSSILVCENPMDRGHRQATVHRVTTEVTEQARMCVFKVLKQKDTLPTKKCAHQCCP